MSGPRASSFGAFIETVQVVPQSNSHRPNDEVVQRVLGLLRQANRSLPFDELHRQSLLDRSEFDGLVSTMRNQRLIEVTIGLVQTNGVSAANRGP